MFRTGLFIAASLFSGAAFASEPTVEMGARMAIIGGCHDCHTAGYAESGGKVDPATALKGAAVGYNGPWGTTYPSNLRLVVHNMSEDAFVKYFKTMEARPPMPWFNLHAFAEEESRALYKYVASLGEPGEPAPDYVPPGTTPNTPYIVFVPVMPDGK